MCRVQSFQGLGLELLGFKVLYGLRFESFGVCFLGFRVFRV